MLSETERRKAAIAPGDQVHFLHRKQQCEGRVLRTNPTRAVVQTADGAHHVPYERITPLNDQAQARCARIASVAELARTLLAQHKLDAWRFEFDHSTRRAGCCHFRDQRITLAFDLARNGTHTEIRDTLLHEIAHALVGWKHHHDAVWRAKAQELGGSGARCHTQRFSTPRYHVSCENSCWHATAERRNPQLICRACGGSLVYSPFHPSCSR